MMPVDEHLLHGLYKHWNASTWAAWTRRQCVTAGRCMSAAINCGALHSRTVVLLTSCNPRTNDMFCRFIAGSGDEHGVLVLSIRNRCREQDYRDQAKDTESIVCVSQLLPAYMQTWLHTLSIKTDGQVHNPTYVSPFKCW